MTSTVFMLADQLCRRLPVLRAALDEDDARGRATSWAASAFGRPVAVDGLRVGSVLYRADGGVTLRYEITVRSGDGRPRQRTLLVRLPPSGDDVLLTPFPADPGLPTLAAASDPAVAARVLGRIVPGVGGERAVSRCVVEVVHHPREGACVLRYRLTPGPAGAGELRHPTVYAKVYADPAEADLAAAALRVIGQGLRRRDGDQRVRVPRPLGRSRPLRLGVVEAVPGRPLLPALVRSAAVGGPWADAVAATVAAARCLAALHRCPLPAAAGSLPARDLTTEADLLVGELATVAPVWPEVADAIARAIVRAVPDAPRIASASVLCHGDYTPSQLLYGRTGVAVVDVDTVCRGEPALDVGRFLAYLHARTRHAGGEAAGVLGDELTGTFLAAYAERSELDGDFAARVSAYRATSLARMALRACRQLKDARTRVALTLLDDTDSWPGRPL